MAPWLLLVGTALADVPTTAGSALVAPPCVADAGAACWDDAPRITRFAAGEGVPLDPIAADVRLAHADGAWLVRVAGLPAGAVAELSLAPPGDQGLADVAAVRVAADGVTTVLPVPPIAPGQIRAARLALLQPDALDRAARWAAVEGPGLAWKPIDVLFVAAAPPPHTLTVDHGDAGWTASAAGATRTVVTLDRPPLDLGSRKQAGPPWQVGGVDTVTAPVPQSGPYVATAIWGPADAPTDLLRVAFEAEVVAPAEASAVGITPAPRVLMLGGQPFVLRDGARLVVADPDFAAAASLLAEEVLRFTGVALVVSEGAPKKGDLWLGRTPPRGVRFRAEPATLPAEGFGLSIDPKLAAVHANDLRGAVYGALALADAIGPDGRADGFSAADWPDLPIRFLYHRIDGAQVPLDVERYVEFLRRVVARGRYNMLVLNLRGAWQWPSHPELPRRNAWTREELTTVLDAARALGLEVVPAMDGPAHLPWVLGVHPELAEDASTDLACTRHPGLRTLQGDLYGDALQAFGQPRFLHAGLDEVQWATERRWLASERCPRCAGSPRWWLLADYLDWTVRFLAERGVRTVVWSDMLLEGWSGSVEGTARTLDVLDPALRKDLVVASWTPIGDTTALADEGFEVWWGMTGVSEGNRQGLHDHVARLGGAGLALFYATPVSVFSPGRSDARTAAYHWSGVLLDGIGLWHTELSDVPATSLVAAASGLPAWRPGARVVPTGTFETLQPAGLPAPAWAPTLALPDRADVEGVPFALTATTGDFSSPVRIPVSGPTKGVSVLVAVAPSRSAEDRLGLAAAAARTEDAIVARLAVTYADGTTATRDLAYGVDVWRPDGDALVRHLWGSAGSLLAASAPGRPPIDRTLFRIDWTNARPDQPITEIRLETDQPDVLLIVAGATAIR